MTDDELRALVEGAVSSDDADTAVMLSAMRRLAILGAETYAALLSSGTPEPVARAALLEIVTYPLRGAGNCT